MSGKIEVTLVKSMIGRPEKHRKVLRSMGLTRMHHRVEFNDTPAVRGMINKVWHLVSVRDVGPAKGE